MTFSFGAGGIDPQCHRVLMLRGSGADATACLELIHAHMHTHRPDASSERHGVGYSTGYAGRTKAEIISSHLSSCVSPEWTVSSIIIVRSSSVSETESEIVVTLGTKPITATTITLPVPAVSVGVGSDFKHIITSCELRGQDHINYKFGKVL